MDFGDRVVVVTGASSGIGECCARRLLELGAVVAGLDIRPSEISGEDFRAYPVDVADDSSVLAAVDDIVQRFGRIDGLVNAAGISTNAKPFYEMTTEEFDRVISVNLRGTFVCSRYVSREMTRSKQGKIVNVSCVRSRIFGPNSADYSASKAGVVALTCAMALDLAPFGIQVNSVAPGATFTGMTQEGFSDPEVRSAYEKTIPAGRIAQPDDIAGVILFLLSESSSYITGETIFVDGGYSISK